MLEQNCLTNIENDSIICIKALSPNHPKIHRCNIFAIYQQLNNAWQDLNIPSIRKWMEYFLVECAGDFIITKMFLGPRRQKLINIIYHALRTGEVIKPLSLYSSQVADDIIPNDIEEEKKIVEMIIKDISVIERPLNRKLKLSGIEVDENDGCGRLDLLFIDKDDGLGLALPLEAKAGRADHRVVGQIDKYVRRYKKMQCKNFWDDAQGIVLAKGYTKTTSCLLKENNIIMLKYELINNIIKVDLV